MPSDGPPVRTAASALLTTLTRNGVDVVFANPGTTEMQLVAAFDDPGAPRPVLTLHENVATGAADGYARVSGRPGAALLHLGSGLSNGAANLHNARRAATPLVTLVGDHATDFRSVDSPLQSDIESLARTVSVWTGVAAIADELPLAAATAVSAAVERRGPATLVVPADLAGTPNRDRRVSALAAPRRSAGHDPDAVSRVAEALRAGDAALLLGGDALTAEGIAAARRVAQHSGAALVAPTFVARAERQPGARIERLPYFPQQATAFLSRFRSIVLVDAPRPVATFAYPGEPRVLVPDGVGVHRLVPAGRDVVESITALEAALGAPFARPSGPPGGGRPDAPVGSGPLDVAGLVAAVAATLPDDAVLVEEAATSSVGLWDLLADVPHTWLGLSGGAIGSGAPLATGAACAAPGRRIVNLEGDGSFLYTAQALWTQARHGLDVTTVVASNQAYAILGYELHRAGGARGPHAGELCSLDDPPIDAAALAAGFGVGSSRVDSVDTLVAALRRANSTPGPHLVDARLAPRR